jgi:hypothetical protein
MPEKLYNAWIVIDSIMISAGLNPRFAKTPKFWANTTENQAASM